MSRKTVPTCTASDWNEVWKYQQARHESSKLPEDKTHNWNNRESAERYDANSRSEYDARIRMTLDGLTVTRGSRVLDIGAGRARSQSRLRPG